MVFLSDADAGDAGDGDDEGGAADDDGDDDDGWCDFLAGNCSSALRKFPCEWTLSFPRLRRNGTLVQLNGTLQNTRF